MRARPFFVAAALAHVFSLGSLAFADTAQPEAAPLPSASDTPPAAPPPSVPPAFPPEAAPALASAPPSGRMVTLAQAEANALAHQPQIQAAALGVAEPVAPGDLPQARQSGLKLQDFVGVPAVMEAQFPRRHWPRAHQ